jgi:predicted kinase
MSKMSKSRIFITIGLPASGKTTLAKMLRDVHRTFDLNLDILRGIVCGDESNQAATSEALRLRGLLLTSLIQNDIDIVISDTNVVEEHLTSLIENILSLGVDHKNVILIEMTTSYDECLHRNASRDRVVPEDVMKRMRNHLSANPYTAIRSSWKAKEYGIEVVSSDFVERVMV